MIDEKRRAQFRAVITAASLVANNDIAETMAVLIGAMIVLSDASGNPRDTLRVAIDSLDAARQIYVARAMGDAN